MTELSDYGLAEFEAERAIERADRERRRYVRAFDLESTPRRVFVLGEGWVETHGPMPLPLCSECECTLSRDMAGDAFNGEIYCSEECSHGQPLC